MKQIVIPTVFDEDTVNAVHTALTQTKYEESTITLLVVKDLQDTYSATETLRLTRATLSPGQKTVISKCQEIADNSVNVNLNIRYQFGISGPLLRHLMEYLECGLVILTPSFKLSKLFAHSHLVKLLLKSKYPLLHLNSLEIQSITTALYIEPETPKFTIQEIQEILSNMFTFRIVGRAKSCSYVKFEEVNPVIAEAIITKQIDVLVETRTCNKRPGKSIPQPRNLKFGLPVLSIYEENIIN